MKLICKCGNIEELKTDNTMKDFQLKKCDDDTLALICKKCNDVTFINFKNN